jgi:LuxR family maltose regulon positive regulatory protein
MGLCVGYLHGCLKTPELIPAWLRTGDVSAAAFLFKGLAFPWIVCGKAVLLSENWVELETLCESLKESLAPLTELD